MGPDSSKMVQDRAYGATEEGNADAPSTRRQTRTLVAALAVALASVCLLTIAVSSSVLDSATVLDQVNDFKTPTLKSLLGQFMHEQGAKASDIASMDNYYKGASKKAPMQMLDDISGEFDPIEDADSNYGRVIGIKSASRTNGAVPEDFDVSPERKAPVQMLDEVKAPPTVWQQIGVPSPTQQAQQVMQQNDDTGYKAPTQMLGELSGEFDPIEDADSNYGRVIGIKSASDPSKLHLARNAVVRAHHRQMTKQMKLRSMIEGGQLGTADKAPTQMLGELSGEFDPIEDADSNYGRVIGIKSASRTNGAVPEDYDVSPERKAPVQMLDEVKAPPTVWQQIGVPSPTQQAQQVMQQNDDTGEFDPIEDADSNYGRVIGIKSASRTNGAVPEDYDVSPERKAPVQMLDEVKAPPTVWQQIGAVEPSQAAQQVMRQNDDTGYKARPQMLYDIDGPQATDASRASWVASAKYDQGAPTSNSVAAAIRAARPN